MAEEPDLGDAADYILGERPELGEDLVWAVLNELQDPPAKGAEGLALTLLGSVRPDLPPRGVKKVLREWRAYARLLAEDDWED
ncbi:MAG: hypothetical protein RIB67_06665 [Miltoncostaeaceae bacterium]